MTDAEWLIGRAAVVERPDGTEQPGVIRDAERVQAQGYAQVRVLVDTDDGIVNTASERVSIQ